MQMMILARLTPALLQKRSLSVVDINLIIVMMVCMYYYIYKERIFQQKFGQGTKNNLPPQIKDMFVSDLSS